jgi:hypothetical protein
VGYPLAGIISIADILSMADILHILGKLRSSAQSVSQGLKSLRENRKNEDKFVPGGTRLGGR